MGRNLRFLIGHLNDLCRTTLEQAAALAGGRGHYEVEIEHWLHQILEQADSDILRVCDHFSIGSNKLSSGIERVLEGLPSGSHRRPVLSGDILRTLESAWLRASTEFSEDKIASIHILIGLLFDPALNRQITQRLQLLEPLSPQSIVDAYQDICILSSEHANSGAGEGGEEAPQRVKEHKTKTTDGPKDTSALGRFTTDLTEEAKAGRIDPIIGRDSEIRQIIDILMRRRQNNPILTGEAGVGKTAVVEGFAYQISIGAVPDPIKGASVRCLDLGLLQAGAGVKGEFENRLRSVIKEVKESPTPIILFIDEAHTLIGAGGAAGRADAANLLKPALARGELRTIAATTWSEYKQHFESDKALTRRFQVVKIEEPTEEVAIKMMRHIAPLFQKHHGVRIDSSAVEEAVRLSSRYLAGRQLPDKAVSVLDTACARVAMSHHASPEQLQSVIQDVRSFEQELKDLEREQALGFDHTERIPALKDKIASLIELRTQTEGKVARQRELVTEIRATYDKTITDWENEVASTGHSEGGTSQGQSRTHSRIEVQGQSYPELLKALEVEQAGEPLVYPFVNGQTIAEVICNWTGIPAGRMMKDEMKVLQQLEEELRARIIGQNHAIHAITQRIKTSKAHLEDEGKPVGVFLLAGPSGVGKTETAMALADALYGGQKNLIKINLSEYQESHAVSGLKGPPPGYKGFDRGGVLTEAIRRTPYSVLLLDELEKAHKDVLKLFYQVLESGQLDDSSGRTIDFRNTIILMTSNLGSEEITDLCQTSSERPPIEALEQAIRPALLSYLDAAFVGRVSVLPYYPISDSVYGHIATIKLSKIKNRLQENHNMTLTWDEDVIGVIQSRCIEVDTGARNVDHILAGTIQPNLADLLLRTLAEKDTAKGLHISVKSGAKFEYSIF